MFNPFKKKEEVKKEAEIETKIVNKVNSSNDDLNTKVKVLESMVVEQRLMIRRCLRIMSMTAEHQRYELIQAELTRLSNMLDKIK